MPETTIIVISTPFFIFTGARTSIDQRTLYNEVLCHDYVIINESIDDYSLLNFFFFLILAQHIKTDRHNIITTLESDDYMKYHIRVVKITFNNNEMTHLEL